MKQLHSTALIIFKWDNSKLHEKHTKIAKLQLPLILYWYTSPLNIHLKYTLDDLAFLLLELRDKALS